MEDFPYHGRLSWNPILLNYKGHLLCSYEVLSTLSWAVTLFKLSEDNFPNKCLYKNYLIQYIYPNSITHSANKKVGHLIVGHLSILLISKHTISVFIFSCNNILGT